MFFKIIRLSIVSLLIFSYTLLAEDQNTSLVNADKSVYLNLLKSLKESKLSNDEIALQKVLLEKLITTPALSATPALVNAENSEDYSNLFNRYLDDALKKESLTKKIKNLNTKIKTLTKEIKNLDVNASSQRTLELQNALYTKSLQEFKEQSDFLTSELLSLEKILIDSLKMVSFNPENLAKKTAHNQEEASKIRASIDDFLVKKERFELLGDARGDRGVSATTINSKEESYNKAVRATITSLFLEFSHSLKSKNEQAFALETSILTEVLSLENGASLKEPISTLLHAMEKSYFGTISTLKGSTAQEFKNILSATWAMLSEPIFTVNSTPITALKLILAALVFVIGVFGGGFYKTSIKRIANNSKTINQATRTILANIGYYVIVITAFFIALNIMGIDLSSIALVAGALSVGIGFGLQNIVSNFVSGIILMFERSIKIGDFVELSDTLRGHVFDIRMRSTTLNTNGNIDVIVPNRNFIENNVINWTMHDKLKRFDIPFGVAYGTKPEFVIEVITKAVEKRAFEDVINTPEKYTNVIMTGMGSSSVDFALQVWIHGEEILAPKKTASRFLIIIYNALYEHGIEIPFPQQDVHIKSLPHSTDISSIAQS